MNKDGDLSDIIRRGEGKNAVHGGAPREEFLAKPAGPRLPLRANRLPFHANRVVMGRGRDQGETSSRPPHADAFVGESLQDQRQLYNEDSGTLGERPKTFAAREAAVTP
jgi:hypothetical protein